MSFPTTTQKKQLNKVLSKKFEIYLNERNKSQHLSHSHRIKCYFLLIKFKEQYLILFWRWLIFNYTDRVSYRNTFAIVQNCHKNFIKKLRWITVQIKINTKETFWSIKQLSTTKDHRKWEFLKVIITL